MKFSLWIFGKMKVLFKAVLELLLIVNVLYAERYPTGTDIL
jgi:hypothetical protein